MKNFHITNKLLFLLIAALSLVSEVKAQFVPTTLTFSYTGSMQQFTVPPCAGNMTIEARGASGGTGGGGGPIGANGGSVKGVFTATPGSVMFFFVGGQGSVTAGGFNGGGNGGTGSATSGAGGGGASDVRIGGIALANRIIVAGAGGGAGGSSIANPLGGIGGGGYSFSLASGYGGGGIPGGGCHFNSPGADDGGLALCGPTSGGGGGFLGGGQGGGAAPNNTMTGSFGCSGIFGNGGNGGGSVLLCGGSAIGLNGGGGGGGGYYGGGGGMSALQPTIGWNIACNSGGAGGSSWANNTLFSNLSYTAGNNAGHGLITISYILNGLQIMASANPPAICLGNSTQLSVSGANNYTWSTNTVSNTISVSPSITSVFSVVATNSIGCFANTTLAVIVNASVPSISISSSAYSVCPGNTVSLLASGGLTNLWSNGVNNGIPFSPLNTSQYTATAQNGCGTSTAAITVSVAPLPVTGITSNTLICAGNTATLTASGASSYTWLPGPVFSATAQISPASSTIYTLFGTFENCMNTSTLSVLVNPNPTISVVASSWSVCSGSSATLSATGANNYTWQPGNQTGSSIVVSPGISTAYMVTGANSLNCTSSANQAIVVFPSPNVTSVSSSSAICAGASVTLSASGANTYLWNNGSTSSSLVVSPLGSTIYSVIGTYTSNGCNASSSLGISVYVSSLTLTPPSSVCMGGTIHLSASGANSYTWNTGSNNYSISVSPASSTSYSVHALTNFPGLTCSSFGTTSVTVNPLPIITAQATKTIVCKNSPSTTLTAGGALTYVWSNSSTLQSIVVAPAVTTVYTLTGTNANNCSNSATIQIKVDPCIGIHEKSLQGNQSIVVYPNPSSSAFTVKALTSMELLLVNELGQVLRAFDLNSENNFEYQVGGLANGIYFIRLKGNSGKHSLKVLVQD